MAKNCLKKKLLHSNTHSLKVFGLLRLWLSHFLDDLSLALARVGGVRLSVSSSVVRDADRGARGGRPRRPGEDAASPFEASPTASAIGTSSAIGASSPCFDGVEWPFCLVPFDVTTFGVTAVAASRAHTFLADGSAQVMGELVIDRLRLILL